MLTFEPKGEINLETYKPDLTADFNIRWQDMKEVAVRLRRYGYKGHPYGAARILNVLRDKFPIQNRWEKLPSKSAIDGWISGITFAPKDPNYDVDSVPKQWRSYVARLSRISEFLWDKPLTGREAIAAEHVGASFNDPFGEEVDLIPQLAMVREYASIGAMGENRMSPQLLEAFDLYFTYAPWKFGIPFYLKQTEGSHIPIATDFMLFASESEGWKEVSPVFDDALRQLGMMDFHFYWDLDKETLASISSSFVPKQESEGKCNWLNILEADNNDRDTWAEIRRVPAEASKHRQVRTEFLND